MYKRAGFFLSSTLLTMHSAAKAYEDLIIAEIWAANDDSPGSHLM